MKVLAIETSCDETAVAIVATEGEQSVRFRVLGNALLSQIDIHKEYGGVFPALAKREHAKNLVPLLEAALEEAELLHEDRQALAPETRERVNVLLAREGELASAFFAFIEECEAPEIDCIAVTAGPGLEPALWVGVNFAKALALAWDKPLVAVNHMEGHVLAALAEPRGEQFSISNFQFPILALLISGGHTELVVMKKWLAYELIGQTRDDAVGEAFDKVARMLGLPYPGGPEISRLAELSRFNLDKNTDLRNLDFKLQKLGHPMSKFQLPRPMLHSGTCDFSFSGLKTAVLYLLKGLPDASDADKQAIALEFENAVTDVLWAKTARALADTLASTLVVSGGVSANAHIRRTFAEKVAKEFPGVTLRIPTPLLATDNAIMIAIAGFYRAKREEFADIEQLRADGNLRLA